MTQAAGYRERTAQSSQRAVGAALPLRVTDRFRGRVTDRPTRVREEIALRSRKIPRPLARPGVPGPDIVRDSLAIPSLIIDRDRRQSAKKQRNTDVQHIHHTRPADPYSPGGLVERRKILTLGEGFTTQVVTLWCFNTVVDRPFRVWRMHGFSGALERQNSGPMSGPDRRRDTRLARPVPDPVAAPGASPSFRTGRVSGTVHSTETDSQRRGLSLSPTLSPLSLSQFLRVKLSLSCLSLLVKRISSQLSSARTTSTTEGPSSEGP